MTLLLSLALAVLLAGALLCLVRVVIGPEVLDRLLAYDLIGTLLAVGLGVFAIHERTWIYLEVAMALAVLAFTSTVAVAKYIEQGELF